MDKQQKQIIISALIIVFIIVWVNAFRLIKQRSKKKSSVAAIATSIPESTSSQTESKQPVIAEVIEERLEWVRCPFSGKIYSSNAGEMIDLKLIGILWDERDPQAIINNKVVGLGDSVGTSTVVEIKQNSVILNEGSRIFEIRLGH
ncbi:MAG: hypothetical protein FJZ11_03035 [Candidatus Omnitrophica bacterium]|nr:hypothetical protein [Candidatus Omnitrophota bacterium]